MGARGARARGEALELGGVEVVMPQKKTTTKRKPVVEMSGDDVPTYLAASDAPITFHRWLSHSEDVVLALTALDLTFDPAGVHFGIGTRGVDEREYVYTRRDGALGVWEVLRDYEDVVTGFKNADPGTTHALLHVLVGACPEAADFQALSRAQQKARRTARESIARELEARKVMTQAFIEVLSSADKPLTWKGLAAWAGGRLGRSLDWRGARRAIMALLADPASGVVAVSPSREGEYSLWTRERALAAGKSPRGASSPSKMRAARGSK